MPVKRIHFRAVAMVITATIPTLGLASARAGVNKIGGYEGLFVNPTNIALKYEEALDFPRMSLHDEGSAEFIGATGGFYYREKGESREKGGSNDYDEIMCYDGHWYQGLRSHIMALSHEFKGISAGSRLELLPFVMPFSFLLENQTNSTLCLQSLSKPEVWAPFIASAGNDRNEIRFKRAYFDGTLSEFTIQCDPNRDFLPVVSIEKDTGGGKAGGSVTTTTVQKSVIISWSGHHIYFPVTVRRETDDLANHLIFLQTVKVDEKSIHIGETAPPGLFRIPRSLANFGILDTDTGRWVTNDEKDAEEQERQALENSEGRL